MLNKRQKKIFELLDKEGLVDKELKIGCLIENTFGGISILTSQSTSLYWVSNKDGSDYRDYYKEECKIIGQVHLGHILQWFRKKGARLPIEIGIESNIEPSWLELTKSPMEYNEEQSKELCSFMENILSY